jgi:uncharacterized protein
MSQQPLELSQQGQTVSLRVEPLANAEMEVSRGDVYAALSNINANQFFIFENAIDSALEVFNSDSESNLSVEPKTIIIAEKRSATLIVKTSPDLMTASMTIVGAYGGNNVMANELLSALKDNHIIKGIRKVQLQELLTKGQDLAAGDRVTLTVAFGKPAEDGTDSQFKPLVEDISQRVLRPQHKADGTVDMLNLGEMVTVTTSQAIMRRIPATPGVVGFNVIGNDIDCVAGQEVPFTVGDGTAISENNENLLVATKSGIPLITPNGMQVDDALIVKGVNATTGHINFDGSVVVQGDVTSGMKVTATGNISVSGFVELAELNAGGDVVVVNGVIGKPQHSNDGHLACFIKAKGKVTSKFAQYVEIDAGNNVELSLHALHCHIRSQGEVIVLDQFKRHGTLSGGIIEAAYSVKALNIGSLAGTPTEISAFSKCYDLRNQLNDTFKLLEDEQIQMRKIHEVKLKLLQIPSDKRPSELVTKVMETKEKHVKKMSSLKEHYRTLQNEYEEVRGAVSITALNHFFSGVSCRLERLLMSVNEEHGPCRIKYSANKLEITSL